MKDLNLLFDCLVGPFAVKVEVLDLHEGAHSGVQLLVAHELQHVDLEEWMIKGPCLYLSHKSDQKISDWESIREEFP